MLDFVLINQMFDDANNGNQKSKSESNRQCISEKKKDTLRRKLKTAFYEPIKTRGWQHAVVSLQNELIYFRNRVGHHFT